MPQIKTTYKTDGSLVREPTGFGGELCHKATQPYEARQGASTKVDTPEALDTPYLEVEQTKQKEAQ